MVNSRTFITTITEAEVEEAALIWLESLGWRVAYGPDISRDGDFDECGSFRQHTHPHAILPP